MELKESPSDRLFSFSDSERHRATRNTELHHRERVFPFSCSLFRRSRNAKRKKEGWRVNDPINLLIAMGCDAYHDLWPFPCLACRWIAFREFDQCEKMRSRASWKIWSFVSFRIFFFVSVYGSIDTLIQWNCPCTNYSDPGTLDPAIYFSN